MLEELDEEEQAKLNILLAYGLNSLFFMYLRTQGINPSDHAVKKELLRVQGYMEKLKKAKQQQLDTERLVESLEREEDEDEKKKKKKKKKKKSSSSDVRGSEKTKKHKK